MWFELIIIGFTLYALFGDYMSAKAEMLHEQAREKEIANDEREYRIHED